MRGAVLVPDVPDTIDVKWVPAVTSQQANDIADKKQWVFVYGTLTYDLVGGGQGKTDYCYIWDVDRHEFVAYGDGNHAE